MLQPFIDQLFEYCDGQIELRAIAEGQVKGRRFFRTDDVRSIDLFIRKHQGCDIYHGVGTRDGQGGEIANLVHLPAVWSDVDFKYTAREELQRRLREFEFRPSIAVSSGGGGHLYWLLREPVTAVEFSAVVDVNQRLADHFGGDRDACDAARILRPPETFNYKYDPPRPVKAGYLKDFRYELDDFTNILPPPIERTGRSAATDIDVQLKKAFRCAFMRYCWDHRQDLAEPLWYAMISNLASLRPGGVSLIHTFSEDYPKYSSEETNAKILQALDRTGPHRCKWIRSQGFDGTGCSRCQATAPVVKMTRR